MKYLHRGAMLASHSPGLNKANKVVSRISQDRIQRELYLAQEKEAHDKVSLRAEGRAEGREEGRAEGREEGVKNGRFEERRKNILSLIKSGVDKDIIVKSLELSDEEVQSFFA